jgi:GNAT superfamily N-acetyltransferase
MCSVFVEPDYRRRGLARELMCLAEAEFGRRGVMFEALHATSLPGAGLAGNNRNGQSYGVAVFRH